MIICDKDLSVQIHAVRLGYPTPLLTSYIKSVRLICLTTNSLFNRCVDELVIVCYNDLVKDAHQLVREIDLFTLVPFLPSETEPDRFATITFEEVSVVAKL